MCEGTEISGVGRGLPALTGGVAREGGRLTVTSAIARGERGVSGAVGRDNVPAVGILTVTSAVGGRMSVCLSVCVCPCVPVCVRVC